MATRTDHALTRTLAAPGEPFVWLTAMGLALGLLMVVGLLGIIVSNGVPVFWPKSAYEIRLKPGVTNPVPNGGEIIVGEIVQKRIKRVPVLGPDGKPIADQTEIQIFVGNKDAYGLNFVFVNNADVASISKVPGILRIERAEYGIAFGFPVGLKQADGNMIAASDQRFFPALQAAIRDSDRLRDKIRKVERVEIGRINSAMNDLKIRGGDAEKMAALDAKYDRLAAEARQLREEKNSSTLVFRTPAGVERSLAVGEIIDAYEPNSLGFFQRLGIFLHNIWNFLSEEPREANTEGGIFPAIFGTFVMTLLMSIAVMPFGVIAAIYLREYANQGIFVRSVRIAVNNLAGVPSIVFGVFGLGFFVYFVGGSVDQLFFSEYLPTPTFGTGGILWAALTLALMTVPVVIVATEEAVAAVPRGMKEGSLACGASKWQTVQRIILPASLPGILTGLILAMARGAGEVAPLMLVGVVKLAPSLPIDGEFPFVHLERKFMHLGFHIYDLGFQSPDAEAAKPMVFATTLLLILLVIVLNLAAILLRDRLRKQYSTGAF
ncbi:MAG: phosphate ABC transporter permease PstA [Terrimicrobiaceae bacterium]